MHHGRLAVLGSPEALKKVIGAEATLDDVFAHYAGGGIEEGGEYRDVRRVRPMA